MTSRLPTTRPLTALRGIRGYRARNRWSLRGTLPELTIRRPYGQWPAGTAHRNRPGPHDTP